MKQTIHKAALLGVLVFGGMVAKDQAYNGVPPPLISVEFIDMEGNAITQIPLIDQDFFNSLVNHLGAADTPILGLEPASSDGPSDWGPASLPAYSAPPLPDKYKFKLRVQGSLWTTPTAIVRFEGFDENDAPTEQVNIEMISTGGAFVSTKAICAVAGQSVDNQVKNTFPNIVLFDPVHFTVKTRQTGGSADLTIIDKATTMVFPAIRWKKSGNWSDLTDAYNNGKVQPEPSGGAIAFDYDHIIELFAIVRIYDTDQKKIRYFCGASGHPATISVVEQRQGSRKTVPLESIDASPTPLNNTVKWFHVDPQINEAIENRWNAATEDDRWADLEYTDEEMQAESGEWKISVGGSNNQGVNRYKVAFGTAESPGAQFRQNTVEDYRIHSLVMRVIVKGDYPNSYLKWASTFVNVPFVDGSHPRQVEEYIAIDCADTCLKSWIRAGNSVPDFSNQSAQSIVTKAQNGTYTMVLAPVAVYPETDTNPAHVKWSQISRPLPGDLII